MNVFCAMVHLLRFPSLLQDYCSRYYVIWLNIISFFVGNGTIDFDEFVVMMQKKQRSARNTEDELKEAFRMFDKVQQPLQ